MYASISLLLTLLRPGVTDLRRSWVSRGSGYLFWPLAQFGTYPGPWVGNMYAGVQIISELPTLGYQGFGRPTKSGNRVYFR